MMKLIELLVYQKVANYPSPFKAQLVELKQSRAVIKLPFGGYATVHYGACSTNLSLPCPPLPKIERKPLIKPKRISKRKLIFKG